jgi:hypothetical protein
MTGADYSVPDPIETYEIPILRIRQSGANYVYIARDGQGQILYVGVTKDVHRRMAGHASSSEWYPQMFHLDVEVYEHRNYAENREADLIRELDPPFNKVFPYGKKPNPEPRVAPIGEEYQEAVRALEDRVASSREFFADLERQFRVDDLSRVAVGDQRAIRAIVTRAVECERVRLN